MLMSCHYTLFPYVLLELGETMLVRAGKRFKEAQLMLINPRDAF